MRPCSHLILTANSADGILRADARAPPDQEFQGLEGHRRHPARAVGYYQNTDFLSDLNLQLETLLSSVHYVGPLREHPKRLYLWSGEEPIHVSATGGRAVEALPAGRGRTMNRRHKERHRTLQVIVAQWLEKMRLIESFDVRPIAKGRKEYEVVLRTIGARAEGTVPPDKVAMYFCEPGPEGSTIHRLALDRFGRIANWPKNFLGDLLGDVAAQTRSAIARMKVAS